MGKKLTPREIENKKIERAINRIKTIEKDYGREITRSACQRYATREREEIRLQKEISEREKELQRLKKKKK